MNDAKFPRHPLINHPHATLCFSHSASCRRARLAIIPLSSRSNLAAAAVAEEGRNEEREREKNRPLSVQCIQACFSTNSSSQINLSALQAEAAGFIFGGGGGRVTAVAAKWI